MAEGSDENHKKHDRVTGLLATREKVEITNERREVRQQKKK